MRKLATIQQVENLIPIENADKIELAQIMGWQCIVKKDFFKLNEKGVYFEIDSFLPIKEKYEFLRSSSYKKNEFLGEGFRIKTQKLRGEISQGLFLGLDLFQGLDDLPIGTDVTEILGIRKWEMPEIVGSAGISKNTRPYNIPKTDEIRVQSKKNLIDKLIEKPYYITTKMDGTSCTMYFKDGQFGVCGRNYEYVDDDTSPMWIYAHKNNIPEKMKNYNKNIAIQGEFCGPSIQKNKLNLKDNEFFVFDIFDIDSGYHIDFNKLVQIINDLEFNSVPIEEEGESFNYTISELLLKAEGLYASKKQKEGIVVRSKEKDFYKQRISFKVLNNKYLLKEE